MAFLKTQTLAAAGMAAFLAFSACSKKEEPFYIRTMFLMGTPVHVKVFTADVKRGEKIADAVFKEWKRLSDEYSFEEPYSYVSYINKKAYGEWVRVDDEFLALLVLSMDYYRLTGGAFDPTFAPLWPVWKEAAASKKMPSKEDISKALAGIGADCVQVDHERKMVRFTRPVQINMGGILRGYCLERGRIVLKQALGDHKYPVELNFGGNVLNYGTGDWSYEVPDPFHEGGSLGRLRFEKGVVMSSSERAHFVDIEGKRYSHILDLRTGYPIPDFSSLIVYFPTAENGEYIPSAVLAVMGKEKAFALLGGIKGATALWIDGSGKVDVFSNANSKAVWEEKKSLF